MSKANLNYERIVITGATSGFGLAFAHALAENTRQLILVARRQTLLEQIAAELQACHSHLHVRVIACDLANTAELESLITSLLTLPAANTLLINNAGVGDYGEFAQGTWNKTNTLLQLNITALTRLCHALIPNMQTVGGDIINVASLAALLPIADFAVYAASKAYVLSFSEALRLELADCGIRVLAVCPGPVATGFGTAARRQGFTGNMMPGRNFFDTSVKTVINDTLHSLQKDRARVFPSVKIRLAALFLTLLPMPIIRWVMSKRPRKVHTLPVHE